LIDGFLGRLETLCTANVTTDDDHHDENGGYDAEVNFLYVTSNSLGSYPACVYYILILRYSHYLHYIASNDDKLFSSLFICALTQQPKGQL
jgi:hypothetical protein